MLRKVFNKIKPNFQDGGKLSTLKPLFEATENICFAPEKVTLKGPHIRDPLDVKRFMTIAILALLPCAFAAVYFFGLRVLLMILVSYVVGGNVEVIVAIIRKEDINEGFLVTGLIFPLILPPTLPLWMVGAGVAFGVLIGKELFGGTGRNLFNPALVGRCFLALSYPAAMTSDWIVPLKGFPGRLMQYIDASNTDAISSATPLVSAKQGVWENISNLIIGNTGGCLGETSVILILLGGFFILLTKMGNWRTVAGIIISSFIVATALHWSSPETYANGLWHLCAGGLLFGAFFMATDPITSPATNGGKWVYGVFIGIVTILIRNWTGYVEGVMFAILLGNIISPLIDEVSHRVHRRRLAHET